MKFLGWVAPRWVGFLGAALIVATLGLNAADRLDGPFAIAALLVGAALVLFGGGPREHDISSISVGRGMLAVQTRREVVGAVVDVARPIIDEQRRAIDEQSRAESAKWIEQSRVAEEEWRRLHPGEEPGPEEIQVGPTMGGPGDATGAVWPDREDYLQMADAATTPRALAEVLVRVVQDAEQLDWLVPPGSETEPHP